MFLQGSYKVTFVRPAGAYPPRELGRQIRIKARSRYHIESGPTPSGDTNIMCVLQHPLNTFRWSQTKKPVLESCSQ